MKLRSWLFGALFLAMLLRGAAAISYTDNFAYDFNARNLTTTPQSFKNNWLPVFLKVDGSSITEGDANYANMTANSTTATLAFMRTTGFTATEFRPVYLLLNISGNGIGNMTNQQVSFGVYQVLVKAGQPYNAHAGYIFRVQDLSFLENSSAPNRSTGLPSNGYFAGLTLHNLNAFGFAEYNISILKVVDGATTVLADRRFTYSGAFDPDNASFSFRVTALGNNLKLYNATSNILLLSAIDGTFISGFSGLSFSGADVNDAIFSSFSLTALQQSECPSGTILNGLNCTFTGSTNVTRKPTVELYASSDCNGQVKGYIRSFETACAGFLTKSRLFVSFRYLIDGVNAYVASAGSAMCTITDLSGNSLNIPYVNATGLFTRDLDFDLACTGGIIPSNTNESAVFCQGINCVLAATGQDFCWRSSYDDGFLQGANSAIGPVHRVSRYFNVECDSNITNSHIITGYMPVKSQQNIISWSQQSGGNPNSFNGQAQLNTTAAYYKTEVGFDQRASQLDCYFGFGVVTPSTGIFNAMVQTSSAGNVDKWSYVQSQPPLLPGQNRYTINCLQHEPYGVTQTKIEYRNIEGVDFCNGTTSGAYLFNSRFRAGFGSNSTSGLNVSSNNTQISYLDRPLFDIEYHYSQNGQDVVQADPSTTTCVFSVVNQTTGGDISGTDRSSLNGVMYSSSTFQNTWEAQLFGPDAGNIWKRPAFGLPDNYTLKITCTNNQCKGNPTFAVNFSIKDNPCQGTDDSCYPVNVTDPNSACFSCAAAGGFFTCDTGAQVSIDGICRSQICLPGSGGCSLCAAAGLLNITAYADLNSGDLKSCNNPGLDFTVRFKNRGADVNPQSFQATCRAFVAPLATPVSGKLPGCKSITGVDGVDPSWCGYEFPMVYDSGINAFVYKSAPDLQLACSEGHRIFGICSGNFGSVCSQRAVFKDFQTGSEGFCPNEIANITGGGFTSDGTCFAGNKPFKCALDFPAHIIKDAAGCGCPEGQVPNAANECAGDRTVSAADITGLLTPFNVVALIVFAPILIALLGYYWRRTRAQPRQEFD